MIDEPILKKRNLLDRIIHNQTVITCFTFVMVTFVIVGSSYAIFNNDSETGLSDVTVNVGNLEVIVSSDDEMLNLNYTTLGVTDAVGLAGSAYTFNVENTGDADVGYYEIRILDKEFEVSTLPHKGIKFALNKNNEGYNNPLNLADNSDYIYAGGPLNVGETDTFNLKIWVSNELGEMVKNKTLKTSFEVILYQELPLKTDIIYDLNGGTGFVPKTSLLSGKITSVTPEREGYSFLGWDENKDATIASYTSGSEHSLTTGMVLYAVWGTV